jgi:NAD(P)-dependent dehydrogenase (short-subunit alcohol dehydrogenase family)
MSGLLTGKSALVTGAASGIGRAIAIAFAREGARVMLSDIAEDAGRDAAAELREQGGDAHFTVADVTDEDAVEALVTATVSAFGAITCAVNNAGITGAMRPIQELPLEEFRRVVDLNLIGVFLCMKHEISAMRHGGGAIVNIASGAGIIGTPALSAYCASKHAVLGLTKTGALENARTAVRINAICPGSTDTPMLSDAMAGNAQVEKMILAGQPGGRLGTPDEIAEAAVWLCSDRASFVNGHSLLVDGGAVAR